MDAFKGTIQAVVEKFHPKFSNRECEALFKSLQVSPSKKFGAELKNYNYVIGRHNNIPKVVLKVVDFSRRQYCYYWPEAPPMSDPHFSIYCKVFWINDATLLLVYADKDDFCVEKHIIDHNRNTIRKIWKQKVTKQSVPKFDIDANREDSLKMLLGLMSKTRIMPNLFISGNQSYIVIVDDVTWDFRFYLAAEESGEIVIKIPETITAGGQKFGIILKSRMVLNEWAYFVTNKLEPNNTPNKNEEYLLRINIADIKLTNENWFMDIDMERFEFVKCIRKGLSFATSSEEWIVYVTKDGAVIKYYAVCVKNFAWKRIAVVYHPNEIAVVDVSSLIQFSQAPRCPLYTSPINFTVHEELFGSRNDNSVLSNLLTTHAV